jgi:hypothetical protein
MYEISAFRSDCYAMREIYKAGGFGRLVYSEGEYYTAVLLKRQPLCDVVCALNLTVPGIVAHQSAMRDGETLKIPQYAL